MNSLSLVWTLKPLILFCLLGLLWLYSLSWRALQQQAAEGLPRWQPCAFLLAILGVALVTASPLDYLGYKALLLARMLEFMLLVYVLPCLFWLGLPATMLYQGIRRWPVLLKLSHLVGASLCFNIFFFILHLPPIFELGLQNAWINQLQLLLVFGFGCLMWLPLLSPFLPMRLSLPRQMFYLVTLVFAQVPLFAILTFSRQVLYTSYLAAPRITPLDAYSDQQLSGWVLKTVSSVIFAAAFIRIFLDWNRQARRQDSEENLTAFENFELAKRAPFGKE